MTKRRTSSLSHRKETVQGVDRLRKYVGKRKVSFYYRHLDDTSERLATADLGDRAAIADAERIAKRRALEIQAGAVIADSVADVIGRFREEEDTRHFADQSRDGIAVRKTRYENLVRFFGRMAPTALKMVHGYQYLDARRNAGAPASANKDIALMQTMCNYWIRWGVIEANPFIGMMMNKVESDVRVVERSQVVRFYLWALRQHQAYRTMGLAAMFTYLTGFRAAEVRPFHMSGIGDDGVTVQSAKRKKGERVVNKLREWSPRLRVVVERAKRDRKVASVFLFPTRRGGVYSRTGWGSTWQDAMYTYIGTRDPAIAAEYQTKKAREAAQRKKEKVEGDFEITLTQHSEYFALQDIRPAAISAKLQSRAADSYDFAAHANPATTHKHYDRRRVKRASATE
ncbi:phage-related integrase [Pandoraea sputorum]|uniref:Phage-related integrase n=1 Tax=Pandoraea sputorum TaxID=93222 RepID=A0A5E5BIR3_9BURK|nr:phage-related integrase [Pandoraea sputorum]